MSSPQSSSKSRDRPQRPTRRTRAANGRSSEPEDLYENTDPTNEPSPRNISQEDLLTFSSDLTPLLGKAAAVKQEIVANLGNLEKLDSLIEEITAALQGRIHVVKGVSDTWGREEEQSKEINELKVLNEGLLRRYGDIEQNFKAEKATLEFKFNSLQAEKDGLEQEFKKKYEQQYVDRKKEVEEKERRLDADHRKVEKRLEVEKVELRKTLENDKKKEIEDMKRKIDGLEAQVESLSVANNEKESEFKKLKGAGKQLQRAYEHSETELASTKNKLEATLEEFRLPEQSNDYL
jgi:chromosome segregation ATPase